MSNLYSEVLFFFFDTFSLHTNGKWCSKSQFVYAYHVLSLSLQEFVWPKYHFFQKKKGTLAISTLGATDLKRGMHTH